MATQTQTIQQPDPKRWKALALLCFANFLVMMDSAIVQIALPSIKETLGYSQESLQWVMSAFLLFFGGFLLLGGRLADLFGNRRIFNLGVIILIISSLFAGLAWSETSLNVARGAQGLASAFIAPAALSLIMLLFSANPKEMGKALAFWGLSGAAGGALGIVLGGVITEVFGWRWTLLIYVPLSFIVLILSPKLLQKSVRRAAGRVDYLGAVLVTVSLMLIVYGIVMAEQSGWQSFNTLSSLSVGGVLFLVFLLVQAKKKEPLVPLSIFKSPNLTIGNISVFLIAASWFPLIYILVLYLQQVLQLSPLGGAMALLPMPILMAIFMIAVAEKLMAKLGIKKTMIVGFIILGIGSILFSQTATIEGDYWTNVLLASLLAALGNALAYLPATTASVAAVESERSGLASGLYNTFYQIGSAIGLAAMVAIAGVATASSGSADPIEALNAGFQQAFFWSGIVAFAGAILSFIFVRRPEFAQIPAEE
ncbi:drug resistance transporter, EmrB/QacA subfamily [Planococcus glaciei]|uniref:MFS transporter n=1 Tax=Planococcus glaciei TaxID=459472 RepID=UPI00088D20F2|nr:MFS transporter [Planococcus glaciei]SDI04705.1 drug resistance transporter, EmrB/QacA subfamily [Planococcus glaciei]